MSEERNDMVMVRTGGLTLDHAPIRMEAGIHSCGNVEDGIAIELPLPQVGRFVVSFQDLKRLMNAAQAIREGRGRAAGVDRERG